MEGLRAPRLCMRTIVLYRGRQLKKVWRNPTEATFPPYPSSAHPQPVWARKGGREGPAVDQFGAILDGTENKNVSNILAKYWKHFLLTTTQKLLVDEAFFLPRCNSSRDEQMAVCDIRASWCGTSIVNSFFLFLTKKANDNRSPTFRMDKNARFFTLNLRF